MEEMHASLNAGYNNPPNGDGYNWTLSGGNPELEPKEAVGVDLSYENYFSDEGYFSVALFWKDLDQWIFDGNYEVDLTGVVDPISGEIPANPIGFGTGKVNGGGGTLQGYEVSVALPFNLFSESLDGFGLLASHTGVSSDIQDPNGNDYELAGLSKRIDNFSFYYENHGFQARTSMRKRSDFKGDVYGIGFDTQQVDIIGETVWDAQLGYDFSEAGISGRCTCRATT
jgi:iron complex outermembrane receptor protein